MVYCFKCCREIQQQQYHRNICCHWFFYYYQPQPDTPPELRLSSYIIHILSFSVSFFSLLLNQNRTYAPTTTFWNNVGRTRRKRIVPDNLAISKRTMCWKGGANINNKIAAPSQQTSPIYFINWWSYHVICKSFELLGLIRKERQFSGPGSAWDFRQMSTLWEETMPH